MRKFFFLLAALAVMGCQQASVSTEKTIVTTTSIIQDWTSIVAGNRFTVVSLVGRDGDSHSYEPAPQDVITLGSASLVVLFGQGLEHDWLHGILESSKTQAEILELSASVALIKSAHEEDHEEDHEGEDHEHGEFDPHVWMSPVQAKSMVKAIRDKLIAMDPEGKDLFTSNAADYTTELDKLDAEIRAVMSSVPEANRKLVVAHRAFGYFAAEYGLEQTASVLSSITTEGGDPSAREMAALVDTIRAQNIMAIFDENISKNPIAEQIAKEAGLSAAPSLYTGALGQPDTPGETYLGMMRYNALTIAKALKGE